MEASTLYGNPQKGVPFQHGVTLEVLINVEAASCRFYPDSNPAAGYRFYFILPRTKNCTPQKAVKH